MKENALALAIDFGTQSVRTTLINKKGDIIAIIKKPYDPVYYSDEKGFAEQDADFYWNYLIECLIKLCNENKDKLDDIVGATITSFRDSPVQLDKDLKPLRKVVLWLDQRMAEGKEKLPLLHRFIFSLVGMKETIKLNRKRTIAHWLKENEPETWAKTYKYVNISTYLTYKLTGNLADSPAGFTGHYPINFKKRNWYKNLNSLKARIFGIRKDQLATIVAPGEAIGIIKDEIADKVGLKRGIILYASGSDKANETVGLGALSNEVAAVSYGTASSIQVSTTKYHEPEPFLPAYPASVPDWYNMEVQIFRGYWMLTWFTKNFASELIDAAKLQNIVVEEVLNKKVADIPPGSDGLVLQPYWGPGLRRPLSKGAIIGFSDVHTREHLYRAIIEGIAYGLRDGMEGIEKRQHHKVKEIMISGGGSQSDIICQITADIFGLPVSRVQTFETTSLGAAIVTMKAAGEFATYDEAIKEMSHKGKTFYPNEKAHEQYDYLFKNVYLKMYPQLKDVYKSITKYNKKY